MNYNSEGFIVKRGDIPNPLKKIIGDMREVMYPHTAMKLRVKNKLEISFSVFKESNKNKLKDYIQSSSGFGVSHMVLFSATSSSMRIFSTISNLVER